MSIDRGRAVLLEKSLPLCLMLVVLVFFAFAPVLHYGLIGIDDPAYVSLNNYVLGGLTLDDVTWAFTTFSAYNWHPVTWLSHMADLQLFGMSPPRMHLVNLLFHSANTLVVFLLLRAMTGALWRSVLVAALFGIHPLHVESVAWVSERKDVLSAFFWLTTAAAYLHHVRRPSRWSRLPVLALYALGLLAKPMLVTLPAALLLLDWWPLGRFDAGRRFPFARLAREKAPLLLLAAASCVVTLAAQTSTGIVKSLEQYPVWVRSANALISYATYLEKTFWPHGLALPYVHPGRDVSFAAAAGALLLLTAVSVLLLRTRRKHPYLSMGWLWFLGTLVPVIGLVQISDQAMADRYTYLPLLGIFVALAWGVAAIVSPRRRVGAVTGMLAGAIVFVLASRAQTQAGLWRDDVTLFGHAVELNPRNYLALALLGDGLLEQGETLKGVSCLETAIEINPLFLNARFNLGVTLLRLGSRREAVDQFSFILARNPRHLGARLNIGIALVKEGRHQAAVPHFQEVLRDDPGNSAALLYLGAALETLGRPREALEVYRRALVVEPGSAALIGGMIDRLTRRMK